MLSDQAKVPLTLRLHSAGRELDRLTDSLVKARLVFIFVDQALYGKALGCFWLVHKQLDACLQEAISRGHPDLQKMAAALEPVYRTPAFEKDLEFFLGPSWAERIEETPEIRAYLDHLARLATSRPELLLAHAYTQHLALLAGGPILRRLARQGMQLPPGKGTAVFEFLGNEHELRVAYKQALDATAANMDESVLEELLEEHCKAFHFNDDMVRAFHVGYLAPIKATLRLVPTSVWVGTAVLAAGVAAALALRYRTSAGAAPGK